METYNDLCTKFYEADKPKAPKDALDFYMEYARKRNGKILEPMCGSGRFLLPMADAGLDIVGFDYSEPMIKLLHAKSASPRAAFKSDIDSFDWKREYKLIFIPSGSIGLVSNQDALVSFLQRIYDSLLPGGQFVFDFETSLSIPENFGLWNGKAAKLSENTQIVLSTLELPPEGSVVTTLCRYELIKNNSISRTEIESIKVRTFNPEEINSILSKCGFRKITFLHAYDKGAKPDFSKDSLVACECVK